MQILVPWHLTVVSRHEGGVEFDQNALQQPGYGQKECRRKQHLKQSILLVPYVSPSSYKKSMDYSLWFANSGLRSSFLL